MKTIKTDYDKYGWRFIVKKSKEKVVSIYLRSNCNAHKFHKPFFLRLDEDNCKLLKKLLKRLENED